MHLVILISMLTSIQHALRVLRKDPVFAVVAIGSLALGIGATSAMFSFADAMLLRPLPVEQPDRVVAINTATSARFAFNPNISYPDYADLRDHSRSFDGLVAASFAKFGYSPNPVTLPHMKFGMYVSGNFFRVLGVEPTLGRGFRPDEDLVEGRDAVVVLGHDFWISEFRGNPSAVGSRIRLNGIDFSVIGVAPEQFTGIDVVVRPTLFVPLAMAPRMDERNNLHDRDAGSLFIKGRLKPGVSVDQARADVAALSAELLKLHRRPSRDQRLVVETELELRVAQGREVTAMVVTLGALGLSVLLVACANVAGLLLSRARARSREIAVRLAIGAGRGALVRQLLLENLLVAVAGGVGGVFLADAFAALWRRIPVPFRHADHICHRGGPPGAAVHAGGLAGEHAAVRPGAGAASHSSGPGAGLESRRRRQRASAAYGAATPWWRAKSRSRWSCWPSPPFWCRAFTMNWRRDRASAPMASSSPASIPNCGTIPRNRRGDSTATCWTRRARLPACDRRP